MYFVVCNNLLLNKKTNKYSAIKQTYGGYRYDSKFEASYAMDLDWRIKAKEVLSYQRQYRLDLVIKGVFWRSYKIDFRVETAEGWFEYVEVKGFPTQEWKQKWDVTRILFQELTEGENARLVLVEGSAKSKRIKIVKESYK